MRRIAAKLGSGDHLDSSPKEASADRATRSLSETARPTSLCEGVHKARERRAATADKRGARSPAEKKAEWPQKMHICKNCNKKLLRGYLNGCEADSDSGVEDADPRGAAVAVRRSRCRIRKDNCRSRSCLGGRCDLVETLGSDCEQLCKDKKREPPFGRMLHTRKLDITWMEYLFREKDATFIREISSKVTKVSQQKVFKKVENLLRLEFLWQDLVRWRPQGLVPALAGRFDLIHQEKVLSHETRLTDRIEDDKRSASRGNEYQINSIDSRESSENGMGQSVKEISKSVSPLAISQITKHCLHELLSQFVKHAGQTDSFIYLVSDILSNRAADFKAHRATRFSASLVAQTQARFLLWNFRVRMGCAVDSAFVLYACPQIVRSLNEINTGPNKCALVVRMSKPKVVREKIEKADAPSTPERCTPAQHPQSTIIKSTHSGDSLQTPITGKKSKKQKSTAEQRQRNSKGAQNAAAANGERQPEKKKDPTTTPKVLHKKSDVEKNNAPKKRSSKSSKNMNVTGATEKEALSKTTLDAVASVKKDDEALNVETKPSLNNTGQDKVSTNERHTASNQHQKKAKRADTKVEKRISNKIVTTNCKEEKEAPTERLLEKCPGLEKAAAVKKVKVDIPGRAAGDGAEKIAAVDMLKHLPRRRGGAKAASEDNTAVEKEETPRVSKKPRAGTPVPWLHKEDHPKIIPAVKSTSRKSRCNRVRTETTRELALPAENLPANISPEHLEVDEDLDRNCTLTPSNESAIPEIPSSECDTKDHCSDVVPEKTQTEEEPPVVREEEEEEDVLPPYTETALEAHVVLEKADIQERNFGGSRISICNDLSDVSSVYEFDENGSLEDDTLRKVCTLTHLLRRKKTASCSPRVLERGKKKKSLLSLDETRFTKEPCSDVLIDLRKKKKKETGCAIQ